MVPLCTRLSILIAGFLSVVHRLHEVDDAHLLQITKILLIALRVVHLLSSLTLEDERDTRRQFARIDRSIR